MKKPIFMLIALFAALMFTACSDGSGNSNNTENNTGTGSNENGGSDTEQEVILTPRTLHLTDEFLEIADKMYMYTARRGFKPQGAVNWYPDYLSQEDLFNKTIIRVIYEEDKYLNDGKKHGYWSTEYLHDYHSDEWLFNYSRFGFDENDDCLFFETDSDYYGYLEGKPAMEFQEWYNKNLPKPDVIVYFNAGNWRWIPQAEVPNILSDDFPAHSINFSRGLLPHGKKENFKPNANRPQNFLLYD